jgi:hypothetical protein
MQTKKSKRTTKRANPGRLQRLVRPHDRTIKRRLKELRLQIDASKDPAIKRISYAMETAITWASSKTVGWESPAATARDLATILRRELNVA